MTIHGGYNNTFGIKSDERLPMKFSKLVEHVSKKPIPPHVRHLVVEVMVSDEMGEDVEVSAFFILSHVRLTPLKVPFLVIQI